MILNLHKISRHKLIYRYQTFASVDESFQTLNQVLQQNKIKVRGCIVLRIEKFEVINSIKSSSNFKLIVLRGIDIKKDWIHQGNLEIRCESNFLIQEMSNLNVSGTLKIIATLVDCRFGKIVSGQDLNITSQAQTFQWEAKIMNTQIFTPLIKKSLYKGKKQLDLIAMQVEISFPIIHTKMEHLQHLNRA
ncbi:hypothetical protein FGO68_gene9285 [Halteria grandinella]|uniref:Uncharacterized protein n=1 Tax=Halteria grandinella TaxID=5974 RepID=A0A8J8P7C3_HALGN|nr:hypothetical protein FGO68_gene9285 [Halteria grandinella]